MAHKTYSNEELDGMSRPELYSLINRLSATNGRLDAEVDYLKNFETLSNCFEEYFSFFDVFSENFLSEKVLKVKNQIKQLVALKRNRCSVSIEDVNSRHITHSQTSGKYNKISI